MFSLVGWQAKAGEYVLCLVLCFVAYNWIGDRAVSHYKTEQAVLQAKVDRETTDKYNKVAKELEDLKLTRASNAITVKQETERIITNQPIIYTSTCWDDGGLSIANAAIKGRGISVPAPTVPADKGNTK